MFKNIDLKTKLIIIVFFILIFILPISYYIINSILKINGNTLDIDIKEKRNKTMLATISDIDKIGENFENYYNDRIPYRNIMIKIDRYFNGISNKNNNDENEIIEKNNIPIIETDPYEENYPAIYSKNNKVILGQSNWLFYNLEPIMDIYQKKDVVSNDYFDKLSNEIKKLDEIANKKGIKIVYLIAPEKQEVYEEYMPTLKIENKDLYFSEELVKKVKENTGIDIIYPRNIFKNRKKDFRIYKKYDSHWNKIGAYLALTEVYKTLNLKLPEVETLRIGTFEECGRIAEDVIPENRDLMILANMDYRNYPKAYEYEIYYNGIKNEKNKNILNKKICIIGDSFVIDMYTKLVYDFDNKTFIHSVDDLPNNIGLEKLNDCDIIFYEIVERHLTTHFLSNIRKIRQKLEKTIIK